MAEQLPIKFQEHTQVKKKETLILIMIYQWQPFFFLISAFYLLYI